MRYSGKKIIVLILGVLVSFAALEVSLRIVGTIYSHWAREGRVVKREPGSFIVLCVGDSYAVGSGAPRGRGYPSQLEELLQKKYPEKQIQVVNRGVGASNTAMILKKFDAYIDSIQPDAIIILAGGANNWNAYGYGNYLKRSEWTARLQDLFYNIKTLKLVRLFAYAIKNKKERTKESRREIKIPPKALEWYIKGLGCEREGKYGEAIHYFEKAAEEEPSFPETYNILGRIHFKNGNREESRRIFRKLIKENPENHVYISAYIIRFIGPPHAVEEKEDIQFIRETAHANLMIEDILKPVTDRAAYQREIGAWVSHDVEEMIRRARGRGVKVIVQNYPSYYPTERDVNARLREVAQKNSVLFVDNEQIFEQLFLKGERKDDYYAFDKEHCNEKGYGVMARNIYDGMAAHPMVEDRS